MKQNPSYEGRKLCPLKTAAQQSTFYKHISRDLNAYATNKVFLECSTTVE